MRAKYTRGLWGLSLMLLMLLGCSGGGGEGVTGDSDTSDGGDSTYDSGDTGQSGGTDNGDTGEGRGSDVGTDTEEDLGTDCIMTGATPSLDWTFEVGERVAVPNEANVPDYIWKWQPDGHIATLPDGAGGYVGQPSIRYGPRR